MEEFKYLLFYPLSQNARKPVFGISAEWANYFFFISHELNMIDPIYADYYISVISHFGSGDRIKVLIFFNC